MANSIFQEKNGAVKKYGIRRAVGASSPKWERLGDSVGMIAEAAIGTGKVRNDFMESVYPYNKVRPCNLTPSGRVSAYLGDKNFSWYGGNGDVMLEVPVFYVDRYITVDPLDDLEYEYRWLASQAIDGLKADPMFLDGDTVKQKVYLPIFEGSFGRYDGSGVLCSVAGAVPQVEMTRDDMRGLAMAKGPGWSLADVWSFFALQHLYLIMFADSDGKSVLGGCRTDMAFENITVPNDYDRCNTMFLPSDTAKAFILGQQIAIGCRPGDHSIAWNRTITSIEKKGTMYAISFDGNAVSVPAGSFVWSCAQRTGATIHMDSANGCVAAGTKYACRFLYIEDWIGNTWDWADGDNVANNIHYLCHDRSAYEEGVYSGKYRPLGYRCTNIEGYLTELGIDPAEPMAALPVQVGGSNSSYYCNSYFCSKKGKRAPLCGSSLRNGKYAGAFFWDVDDPDDSLIWNVSGRPLYK